MGSKPFDQEQEYSERETAKRADAALRVALSTPRKPHEMKVGGRQAQPDVRKRKRK